MTSDYSAVSRPKITGLRIAMIACCPFPWPRGTPIRIFRMAEALATRGHEVHVFTYHLGEPLSSAFIHVHRIGAVRGYHHTAPGPTLRKLLQLDPMLTQLVRQRTSELRFDIVHAHHYEGLIVALRARGAAPIIYDAHTTLGGELPQYRLGLPAWLLHAAGGFLDRRLPGRADHTIAVSHSIRTQLIDLRAVQAQRVTVIPNGVETAFFTGGRPAERDRSTVLFTGNLASYQRIDLLLRAFALLHSRCPGTRLLLVTESAFEPYESLARALGIREAIAICNVPFSEHGPLLATAGVAVNPRTQCDGLPQKLMNYMAAGVPIVSAAGSAVGLEHERTALCVPNDDADAMSRAIERLQLDPGLADRIACAARLQVEHRSWDAVAGQVEGVYDDLLAMSPGAPKGAVD